jgi:hypothetical protein
MDLLDLRERLPVEPEVVVELRRVEFLERVDVGQVAPQVGELRPAMISSAIGAMGSSMPGLSGWRPGVGDI